MSPRSLLLTCALLSAGIAWAEEPAKPRPARRWSLDPRAQLAASPRTSDREDALRFQRDVCGHREAEFDMPRKDEKRDHIFVSVASYRDDSCKRTIADLFAKADHPERITVGVVQQNQAGTAEDCVAGCPSCLEQQKRGRIVVKDYDYTEARGPAYARWAASRLWDGSEFFLQIDAHSSFQPGWDRRIVEQYRALGDPKAVLTHHPPADGAMASVLARGRTTLNCRAEFDDDGVFAPRARSVPADGDLRSPFAAGGFLFLPGRVLHEVPWDPYLVFLFHPEEALSSARLWTAGFNLYAPRVPVISHTYHQHPPGPWRYYEQAPALSGCRERALTRARFLLGMIPLDEVDPAFRAGLDRYGVGAVRSLSDYYDFAGLKVLRRAATSRCPGGRDR